MGNFEIINSNKKLKDLDFNGINGKKDRIIALQAEALFFLIFGYKLNTKKIDFLATGVKNKMDFFYTLNKKLIGVDYELVGDILFHSKKDMWSKQKVLNPYLSAKKIKDEIGFVKCGYPKIILRKFVRASEHKNLLNLLNNTFQKDTFRKRLFEYDTNLFNDFYQNIKNDTYGSYKNSYNSYVNISKFIEYSKNKTFIEKEKEIKVLLDKYYNNKKNEMKYDKFYLFQSIITAKNGTIFLQKLKDFKILDLFSDFIDHYKSKTEKLNNGKDTISYLEIVNSFKNKDLLLLKLKDLISAWKGFDFIIIDINNVIKNIGSMDFVYEKTEKEKKNFDNTVIDNITGSDDFKYRTYLFPKNKKSQEKILVDVLPF